MHFTCFFLIFLKANPLILFKKHYLGKKKYYFFYTNSLILASTMQLWSLQETKVGLQGSKTAAMERQNSSDNTFGRQNTKTIYLYAYKLPPIILCLWNRIPCKKMAEQTINWKKQFVSILWNYFNFMIFCPANKMGWSSI